MVATLELRLLPPLALYIGMNMYCLYVLGPLLEKMWGRAVFIAIYLAACVGGSMAAQVYTPEASSANSGAICGLLGSMATWLELSCAYLPEHIVGAWRNNIIQNVVLILVISFLPGVSMAGHVGGGVTGAVVAAPLWYARFGRGYQRLLGWLAMTGIVVAGLYLMYPQVTKFAHSPEMDAMRERDAKIQRVREALTGDDIHLPANRKAGRR